MIDLFMTEPEIMAISECEESFEVAKEVVAHYKDNGGYAIRLTRAWVDGTDVCIEILTTEGEKVQARRPRPGTQWGE